jgi:large subunit ribosomal protein L18
MIIKKDRNESRKIRHIRVRQKVAGTADKPRLNVFRSLNEIYAQVIDDTKGITLVSASTKEKALADALKGKTKTEQAKLIGEVIAKRALEHNITQVVFDRGGYIYTGRVAALAEGARSQGLNF